MLTAKKVYGDLLAALKPKVEALTTGNQLDEKNKVGPMVKESEAVRVDQWIHEAVGGGAKLVAGGGRRGRDLFASGGGRRAPGHAHIAR